MDTIGQQLKAAREHKGVTASQAAATTHMKVQQIEALERDDYSRLTVPTYAKGFLRLYAEYLGLDAAPLLRDYNALLSGPAAVQPAAAPAAEPEGSVFKSTRRPLPVTPQGITLPPELLTRALQGAAGLVVLLLLIWGMRHGCHRTPAQPVAEVPPPPAVASQPRTEAPPVVAPPIVTPPIVAPAKREPPAPWIIINEPPPPYLKRSATGTP